MIMLLVLRIHKEGIGENQDEILVDSKLEDIGMWVTDLCEFV